MCIQDSLDNINDEANEKYSKAFFEFFQQKLDVPAKRGYISFIDPGRGNIGYATFSRRLAHCLLYQLDMTAPHLPPFLANKSFKEKGNSSEVKEVIQAIVLKETDKQLKC